MNNTEFLNELEQAKQLARSGELDIALQILKSFMPLITMSKIYLSSIICRIALNKQLIIVKL